jgi:transcriptional regulator with XRE-family HTH domain
MGAPGVSQSNQQNEPSGQRATSMDRHVGARVRERRVLMGLSQQQLARMLSLTYQQVHKYERGLNRISSGRLFEMAQALKVEPAWFFAGLAEQCKMHEVSPRQRMCIELARNFALIKDEKHREALSHMARSLAAQSGAATTMKPEDAPSSISLANERCSLEIKE